jgi:hypothetical protein
MPEDVEGRPEERPLEPAPETLSLTVDGRAPGEVPQMTAAESMRVWIAMQLSPNVEVCSSLLRGEYVSESALDAGWLEFVLHLRMIAIKDAIDFFPSIVAEDQRAA